MEDWPEYHLPALPPFVTAGCLIASAKATPVIRLSSKLLER